jgi:hypothetical protein
MSKENITLSRSLFESALRKELVEEPTQAQVDHFMQVFGEWLFEGRGHGGGELQAYAEHLAEEWEEKGNP